LRLARRIAAVALVLMPLILYAPFLFGGKVLYWGVYMLQFYPWRQLAVGQMRAGHWPLWNPGLGAGTPLAANLQTAAFYPPNVLFLLMPVERAFGWELALHVAIAGLSAYALGRTLGMSRFGALVSGLAYGCGGYLVAHWVFPSMVYAAAWLPLLLALAERVVRRIRSGAEPEGEALLPAVTSWLFDLALLAGIFALQFLAGHAQTSYYSAWMVAAFALYRLLQRGPEGPRPGMRRLRSLLLGGGSLALAAVWGAALAAIQLLPTAEFVANSQRAGTLTDATFAYELSFWPWRLITLLAPDFFGHPARGGYWAYGTYWEEAGYVGLLPLLLAVAGVAAWWGRRQLAGRRGARGREGERKDALAGRARAGQVRADQGRGTVPFFVVLCLVSILLALGEHTPLYPLLFRLVPGMGWFQAPARLMVGYALGVAVLAGIGASVFRLTPRTRSLLRVVLVVGLGVAMAGGAARLILPTVEASFGNSALRLGMGLAVAAGALLLQRGRLGEGRWQGLVVILVAVDLLAFGWGLAPGTDPAVYRAPVATAEFLKEQAPGRVAVLETYAQEVYERYVSLSSFGDADAAYLGGLRESLLPNLSAVHSLEGVGNYDPLRIGLYQDLAEVLERRGEEPLPVDKVRRVLDLFGARYWITDAGLDLPVLYEEGPRIYDNEGALPAAWIAPRARVVEEAQGRLELLLDPGFDPRSEVILSRAPAKPLVAGSGAPEQAPATVLREGPNRVIIEASLRQPGVLVLADTYYPGWQATVDGTPAEILPANHAFRAVPLDNGEHRVVFEYSPLSFRVGAWITAVALVLVVVMAGISGTRGRIGKT
jgi:hypothetical protein